MSMTLRFQSTGAIPGRGDPVTMAGSALTIGRGPENDLVLPDPNRELSKRHCAIEDHNGNLIVVDFSTNGTFLNYSSLPLGPTPTPLNHGDILTVGPYELLVDTQSGAQPNVIADPLEAGPLSRGDAARAPSQSDLLDAPGDGGDFIDDLLGGNEGLKGPGSVSRPKPGDDGLMPPLGEDYSGDFGGDLGGPREDPSQAGFGSGFGSHQDAGRDHFSAPGVSGGGGGGGIPDDWDDIFGPGSSAPGHPPQGHPPQGQPQRGTPSSPFGADGLGGGESFGGDAPQAPPAQNIGGTFPAGQPESQHGGQMTGGGDAGTAAFLRALGAQDVAMSPQEVAPTMARMGKVLHTMISGLRDILMTRRDIKSEFRMEQTMIQRADNNPLKFSLSIEQAIESMVRPTARGYLSAERATEEALRDIKAHEVAVITGMEAALKGVLAKLDPHELEKMISRDSSLSGMLKSRKARYWEIYEDRFAEISDQAENDFHELFAKEFSRAYQAQLEKLK